MMYVEVQLKGRPKLINKVTKHNQRNITRLSRGETEAFTKESLPNHCIPIIALHLFKKVFLHAVLRGDSLHVRSTKHSLTGDTFHRAETRDVNITYCLIKALTRHVSFFLSSRSKAARLATHRRLPFFPRERAKV